MITYWFTSCWSPFFFFFFRVCVSHCGLTETDVTEASHFNYRFATKAAMVLTTQVGTSATVFAVNVVVVEVAERWSA